MYPEKKRSWPLFFYISLALNMAIFYSCATPVFYIKASLKKAVDIPHQQVGYSQDFESLTVEKPEVIKEVKRKPAAVLKVTRPLQRASFTQEIIKRKPEAPAQTIRQPATFVSKIPEQRIKLLTLTLAWLASLFAILYYFFVICRKQQTY